MAAGILYVVATPIGNLQDLSPRARQVLAEADIVAAEDTRHTGKLLAHFSIGTRKVALHQHNESAVLDSLLTELTSGMSIALVSDAGTPLISDPGYRLVSKAHDCGITVSPLPGPSAVMASVSASGLPTDRFSFEGFLPAKRDARQAKLQSLKTDSRTLVFFESVHRIEVALEDMCSAFGSQRNAFMGREISKLHEQTIRATLGELCASLESGDIVSKGEFVIVVGGATKAPSDAAKIDASELLAELVSILPGSQAVDVVSRLSGRKRNDVYKEMLTLKSD